MVERMWVQCKTIRWSKKQATKANAEVKEYWEGLSEAGFRMVSFRHDPEEEYKLAKADKGPFGGYYGVDVIPPKDDRKWPSYFLASRKAKATNGQARTVVEGVVFGAEDEDQALPF